MFVCLIATTLQWHLPTYIATGDAVGALRVSTIDGGGE